MARPWKRAADADAGTAKRSSSATASEWTFIDRSLPDRSLGLRRFDLIAQPADHRGVDAGGEVEHRAEAAGLALRVELIGQRAPLRGRGLHELELAFEHGAP